jgi:hypothetical protein
MSTDEAAPPLERSGSRDVVRPLMWSILFGVLEGAAMGVLAGWGEPDKAVAVNVALAFGAFATLTTFVFLRPVGRAFELPLLGATASVIAVVASWFDRSLVESALLVVGVTFLVWWSNARGRRRDATTETAVVPTDR